MLSVILDLVRNLSPDGGSIYLRKKRQALQVQIVTMAWMQLIMAGGFGFLLLQPGAPPLYLEAVCLYLLYACGSWLLTRHLRGSMDDPDRLMRRVGWLSTALLVALAASVPVVNAWLTRDQPLALAALAKGLQVEIGIIVILMAGLSLERSHIKVATAILFGMQLLLLALARLDDRVVPAVRTYDGLMSPAIHFGQALLRSLLLPVAGWVALLYVRNYADLLSRLRPWPKAGGGPPSPAG